MLVKAPIQFTKLQIEQHYELRRQAGPTCTLLVRQVDDYPLH